MFISLWDARKGDTVVLDLVDGTSRTYVVTQVLPRVPWDAIGVPGPDPDRAADAPDLDLLLRHGAAVHRHRRPGRRERGADTAGGDQPPGPRRRRPRPRHQTGAAAPAADC